MSSTGNGKDWRGGRPVRPQSSQGQQPEPAWKRKKITSEAGGTTHRPWRKILAAGLLCLLLVSAGILLWRPPVNHQFLAVLYQGGQIVLPDGVLLWNGAAKDFAGWPTEALPRGAQVRQVRGDDDGGISAAIRKSAEWLEEKGRELTYGSVTSETVLLFVQTGVIRGSDGTIRLLNRLQPEVAQKLESGPGKTSETISDFKDALGDLLKSRPLAKVVVLLDLPAFPQAGRLGLLDPEALAEFAACVQEEPFRERVVVVQSAGPRQVSWPWGSGGEGQTAFARFALEGLRVAGAGELSTFDYLKYVKEQTEAWVEKTRGKSLQTVLVHPDLESTRGWGMLQQRLPKAAGSDGRGPLDTTKQKEALRDLWKQAIPDADWPRDPELTELLRSAELALLTGSTNDVDGLLAAAQKMVAGPGRLPGAVTSAVTTAEDQKLPEYAEVLAAGWDAWRTRCSPALPEERRQQLVATRQRAEQAALAIQTTAARLEAITMQAEKVLLRIEDESFLEQAQATDSGGLNFAPATTLWDSTESLAKTIEDARRTLWKAAPHLPGYLAWCAATDVSEADDALQTRLQQLVGLDEPADPEDAAVLRQGDSLLLQEQEIQRGVLLLTSRLRQLHRQVQWVPDNESSGEILRQKTADIRQSVEQSDAAWDFLQKNLVQFAEQSLQQCPDPETESIQELQQSYHRLLLLLNCTSLSPETRFELLDRAEAADRVLQKKTDDAAVVSRPALSAWSSQSLRWQLQILRFMQSENEALAQLLQRASGSASAAPQPDESSLLRTCFESLVTDIRKSMDEAKEQQSALRLESLILEVALLPGMDASAFRSGAVNPAALLTSQWSRDFRRLQAERIQIGGWLDVRQPESVWYLRRARSWWPELPEFRESGPAVAVEASPDRVWLADPELVEEQSIVSLSVTPFSDPARLHGTAVLRLQESAADALLRPSEYLVRVASEAVRDGQISFEYQPQLQSGRQLRPSGAAPLTVQRQSFFRGRLESSGPLLRVDATRQWKQTWQAAEKSDRARLHVSVPEGRPVVFLLDWSESMGEQVTSQQPLPDDSAPVKSKEATTAILEIVGNLGRDRKKSLRVFGHRWIQESDGASRESSFEKQRDRLGFELQPGRQFFDESEKWTQSDGLIFQTSDKQKFLKAFELLEASEPFGQTPLYESLKQCLRYELSGTSGVVVALTDGSDSTSNENDRLDLLRQLATELQKRQESGQMTRIQLVLFSLNVKETEQLKADLAKVSQLQQWLELHEVQNRQQIIDSINRSLTPEPLQLLTAEGAPVRDVSHNRSNTAGETTYDLDTSQGSFKLQLKGTEIQTPILQLLAGDELKLVIDWKDGKFVAQKPTVSKQSRVRNQPSALEANIPTFVGQVGGMRRRPETPAEMEVVIALGNNTSKSGMVRQPTEVGLRYRPAGAVSVEELRDVLITETWIAGEFGVPAWRIHFDKWPERRNLLIESWWKMERTPTQQTLVLTAAQLRQRASGEGWQKLTVGGEEVECTGSYRPEGLRLEVELRIPGWDQLSEQQQKQRRRELYGMRVEVGEGSREGSAFQPSRVAKLMQVVRLERGRVLFRYKFPEGSGLAENADVEIGLTTELALRDGALVADELEADYTE
jgi:hypothetical protein